MLKSQVPVFICSLALIFALPSAANSESSEPGEIVTTAASTASGVSMKSSKSTVAFTMPGKQGRKFVDSYLKDNDEALTLVRQRSKRPFEIIDSIFDHYGIPSELKYLAVIESELRSTALSRVGARGPWQLMAATARDLGLKVNSRSDERTNYYKSTRAAALYLRDLHRQFKDWLLVLAAYNAGPLPVTRAIHRSQSHNFWALERYLPRESRQHVKRFIATATYFNGIQAAENANYAQLASITTEKPVQDPQDLFPEILGTL